MTQTYRKSVVAIIRNLKGEFFFAERVEQPEFTKTILEQIPKDKLTEAVKFFEKPQWQFPQGKMEEGETVLETAKREVYEETGMKSLTFRTQTEEFLRYDFPSFLPSHKKYSGQEQIFVLFDFFGDDSEIRFDLGEEIEFQSYEWIKPEKLIETILERAAEHRKKNYVEALNKKELNLKMVNCHKPK
ncbi:NUDIX domain-containing protein [bacterium]|nr:NUDIX domain-containing protein [bacterium]